MGLDGSGKKEGIIRLLVSSPDMRYREIGNIVGCSKQYAGEVAIDFGLIGCREPGYHRSDITVEKVLQLYHEDLLIKDIVRILGCAVGTITRRLREARISKHECYSRGKRLAQRKKG